MSLKVDVGARVRSTVTFRNLAGAIADPTSGNVVAKYRSPGEGGTTTTKTYPGDGVVVKVTTGVYYIDVDVSEAGEWAVRWNATAGIFAASEETIIGKATAFD